MPNSEVRVAAIRLLKIRGFRSAIGIYENVRLRHFAVGAPFKDYHPRGGFVPYLARFTPWGTR